ncbi:MAG: flagellar export chaperone FliS [Planctomycetes bacterium]|nr:flagellar export chaperone FliS [Planctomycetota bacterium]
MLKNTARSYLETQIRTASKEQLLIMLFDGAIRFCNQAKVKIEDRDIEGSYNLLIKAQNIVMELMCSLDRSIGEDIYNNLVGLYNFIYLRLVDANIKKDNVKIDEALKILVDLRGTWSDAIDKAKSEGDGVAVPGREVSPADKVQISKTPAEKPEAPGKPATSQVPKPAAPVAPGKPAAAKPTAAGKPLPFNPAKLKGKVALEQEAAPMRSINVQG